MSKLRLAEVAPIRPCDDIVAMLRQMADNIESGEFETVRSVTCVAETQQGNVEVFGWGDLGLLRSIGVLHLGIDKLSRLRLSVFDEE